ncbi:pentatricopeptide repeat-containing protein At5g46100-like [Telopea speciosissima]|uniref:pentatricopeptide repeat-containing protein At5g46100-like n=1 Tax=Telopea speciosissima TaxID=54955 RepID=UPI001CC629B1|nr:pentatricopeptide repeat-containing protein At5g46100-like [Telopea speciosissima]
MKSTAMSCKTLTKWSKQITSSQVQQLIRAERDIQKALLVFDSATAEYSNGFRHDQNSFGLMISRLVSANQFREAEELLNRMKEEKCNITEDIFLSICRAYGRAHKPLDAVRIFQRMKEFQCELTEKSYVTVFSTLVNESQMKMAQRFYKYMKEMGIPPSVASLNVLIKALCMNNGTIDAACQVFRNMPNRGCIPDSYTYGTLINGLCKCGRINEAKELFKEMEAKGCSPSVITYTSLIHGSCLSNNLDEAMGLFKEMRTKGINPNVVTYSSLMDGLCKGGRSSQAMELLEKMVGDRHPPNMITYSTLINGLCKERKLREALEILDRMKVQGLKPDAGLYGKIINGLCDLLKFQEAANFLDEMVLGGISPNRLTWNLHVKTHNRVVQGLCTEKNGNRAFQVYLSMRSRGISISADTFSALVSYFSKKGDIHKSARIVDEMVVEGCVPDEAIWFAVVGGFWCRRKVHEAAELVLVQLMDESCSLSTVFLGNHPEELCFT